MHFSSAAAEVALTEQEKSQSPPSRPWAHNRAAVSNGTTVNGPDHICTNC